MSRMTQMENAMFQMQANVSVPNLPYVQLHNLSSGPAVLPVAETIPNSIHFKQNQISMHTRELLSEHGGDSNNQENFDPWFCQVVAELNGDRERQQKISEHFDQSRLSSSHERKKKTTVEDNVSEDGNLQLH